MKANTKRDIQAVASKNFGRAIRLAEKRGLVLSPKPRHKGDELCCCIPGRIGGLCPFTKSLAIGLLANPKEESDWVLIYD